MDHGIKIVLKSTEPYDFHEHIIFQASLIKQENKTVTCMPSVYLTWAIPDDVRNDKNSTLSFIATSAILSSILSYYCYRSFQIFLSLLGHVPGFVMGNRSCNKRCS